MSATRKVKPLLLGESSIVQGDALALLDRIPDESVKLVLTSPPYNIGKSYERGMFSSLAQYSEWMRELIEKIMRKVRPDGSICWQVGNHVADGAITPLDMLFFPMFTEHGCKLRNRIVWTFNFGLHAQRRFSGRYETLLWFTRSDDYTFNLDPIRVEQLYPGKRHSKAKGDRAGRPSGNPQGKNPSDFWVFDPEGAFINTPIWDIPNVKANHVEKAGHPCQFPSELADRCILAMTNEGDVVLDPFVGAGTSVILAEGRSRIGIGFELDKQHAANAQERLEQFGRGELPLRLAGKPPVTPNTGDKVAQTPEEWLLQAAE
ncbi:MAG: site-specific DNA-methyltransferase [Sphingopyxis sp.]|nr:site-specific DNA-methyltransferase [Sphingopyxis sp.]